MHHVLIVESPSKAKTINKYLGKDYTVLASYGHIRDLPAKDGSVLPDDDFSMTYVVDDDAKRPISAIVQACKTADSVLLATDPDREGEAISWHVLEVLKEKKAIPKNALVKRVTFNEITKKAIQYAVEHPRDIDMDLVNAQQARRALDYLVGFTLSPVLWRKLPGSRSAGRVQSVALRAICEREEEIEKFVSREYWDITVQVQAKNSTAFAARLSHWEGQKLEKFSLTNEEQATKIAAVLEGADYKITDIEQKQTSRNPAAPFTTSTIQQEASRKLGFSASRTMQIAQQLYEGAEIGGETVGLITYMRTDGVTLSMDAIGDIRSQIGSSFGKDYVPDSPRIYKTKAKNAQEAHEAIRPTDISRTPDSVAKYLNADQKKLYELVWKRTIASQMASAILDQTAFIIDAAKGQAQLRATGTVIRFPGFLAVYQEGRDDVLADGEEDSRQLPALSKGTELEEKEVKPEQHFTEPLPRYSEASLVKKLEELGIGRPSTYASILSVLQDRNYVTLDKKRFIPEARGRIVNAFLVSFFQRYVQYDFTAQLEDKLDAVSAGEMDWKAVLTEWWKEFSQAVGEAKELRTTQVLDEMDELLGSYIFGNSKGDGHDPRECPMCKAGRLSLKLGKFGAFVGCSLYPECSYTRQLTGSGEANAEAGEAATSTGGDGPKELGIDPKTGETIWMKKGPYGWYVQLTDGSDKTKIKRASLPTGTTPDLMTLEMAIPLLALPRDIGPHPETKEMIVAGIGRYGPYLLHNKKYTNLAEGDDIFTIGINRAVDVIASAAERGRGARAGAVPTKILGKHPEDGADIGLYSGQYGPYVMHGGIRATLPKNVEPDQFDLDEAVALLAQKAAQPPKKGGRFARKGASKAPAKKAAPKKTTAAKPKAPAKATAKTSPAKAATKPKAKVPAKKRA